MRLTRVDLVPKEDIVKILYSSMQGMTGRVWARRARTSWLRAARFVVVVGAAASLAVLSASPAIAVPVASTTTLAVSPTAPLFGQAVTLTATVTCTTPATGTVDFLDGVTVLGTVTLAGGPPPTAAFTVNGLAPGAHTFTARYNGDVNCLTSTSAPAVVTVGCQLISGIVNGNLNVTQPTCLAPATQVNGGVTVSGTGALASDGATINGALIATGGTGLRICGTTITGTLFPTLVNGVIIVGETDDVPTCAGNTITGTVNLQNNTGFVELDSNQITGGVIVINNATTLLVPPEKATASEIETNHITGALTCTANTPAPTNGGHPNTVTGALRIRRIGRGGLR
jgi:hypothetical protein